MASKQKRKRQTGSSGSVRRKTYIPPKLTVHGTVEKITAGGVSAGDMPSGGLVSTITTLS